METKQIIGELLKGKRILLTLDESRKILEETRGFVQHGDKLLPLYFSRSENLSDLPFYVCGLNRPDNFAPYIP